MSGEVLLIVLLCFALLVLAGLLFLCVEWARERSGRLADRQRLEQLINQAADEVLDSTDRLDASARQALSEQQTASASLLSQLGQSQTTYLDGIQRQMLMSSHNQEERLAQVQSALTQALAQHEQKLDALRESLTGAVNALRQENDRQLTEMRRTVDEKLTESLDKRLSESFSQVSARLEQVYTGLGEMKTLAAGVGDLKKVLTNVKTRGIWGEMQLGALLEEMLSPAQYETNVEVVPGSRERVEYAIRLPGRDEGTVWLPVDSKFPQEDWLRLQSALEDGSAEEAAAARKALAARLRTEAARISGKYVMPPHSTDFAVMFLPVEGLYAEAVRMTGTVEEIQRERRVVIAGPTTFSALLNALQMGFRTLAVEQRSGEVWQLLGAVKTDFAHFSEVLEKTRQRLQQASDSIDTAVTRTNHIRRRLNAVEETGAEVLSLTAEREDPDEGR